MSLTWILLDSIQFCNCEAYKVPDPWPVMGLSLCLDGVELHPSVIEWYFLCHYSDVTMGAMASQITSLTIVYSTIYSDADQRKHQSPALLAFVQGIHRWPVNSTHKWLVTRKMSPYDDVIMQYSNLPKYIILRAMWSLLWSLLSLCKISPFCVM